MVNYSLTTFAFVLPFYSDSGQIAPINVLIILALKMANSKAKPESIKLLSLNVRGLSNFHNGRAIFSWCRKRKVELVFLQETHSITERRGAPRFYFHMGIQMQELLQFSLRIVWTLLFPE